MQVGLLVFARQADAKPAQPAQEHIVKGQQRVGQLFLVAGQAVLADVPAVGEQRLVHRARAIERGQRRHAVPIGNPAPFTDRQHRVFGRAAQDQVADGRVDQPHLEHLGHAAAVRLGQAAGHHHREDHRRGGADAVLGVLFELAGRVQRLRQVGDHVALGQAGAEQQQARQHALVHEQRFGARDLRGVGPGRQAGGAAQELLDGARHGRRRGGPRAPVRDAGVVGPVLEHPAHVGEQLPALGVRRHQFGRRGRCVHALPGPKNRGDGGVGQRIGLVLHAVELFVRPGAAGAFLHLVTSVR